MTGQCLTVGHLIAGGTVKCSGLLPHRAGSYPNITGVCETAGDPSSTPKLVASDHHLPHWRRIVTTHPYEDFIHYVIGGWSQSRVQSHMLISVKHALSNKPRYPDGGTGGENAGSVSPGQIGDLHASRMGVTMQVAADNQPVAPCECERLLCSLSYTMVEAVATAALWFDRGTLLVKLNIKSAYMLVPVNPYYRHLLRVRWRAAHYGMLLFGLRSAPEIITAMADTPVDQGSARSTRFCDSWPPNSDLYQQLIVTACSELGVPWALNALPTV